METPIRFFSGKAKDLDRSYECFSNFAPISVTIDGLTYPTTEHYFQAMKFIAASPAYAEQIRNTVTPNEAKKLGKNRKYPIPDNWNDLRIDVMNTALFSKAVQNKNFYDALLRSGDSPLVEASPFDTFWGEGKLKNGKNMLGKALMVLRERLINHKNSIYTQ
jgi:N-glycosidase YbiA